VPAKIMKDVHTERKKKKGKEANAKNPLTPKDSITYQVKL